MCQGSWGTVGAETKKTPWTNHTVVVRPDGGGQFTEEELTSHAEDVKPLRDLG